MVSTVGGEKMGMKGGFSDVVEVLGDEERYRERRAADIWVTECMSSAWSTM